MTTQQDYEGDPDYRHVVVMGADGIPLGTDENDPNGRQGEDPTSVAELVEQPAKVMRIGSMIKQLLEEGRSCGSPRRSWSAGSKGSSTGSRPRCSPSRWPPGPSWNRSAGRCRRAA